MNEIDFKERRRFKGDKKWWGRCEDCNDWEFYPVKEHRRWHELYDYLEGAAWTMNWASDEMLQMLGRKTFTFKDEEHTQQGERIFSVRVTRTGPKRLSMIMPTSSGLAQEVSA